MVARCHIIGAGLAGLSTAVRLCNAGIDVSVYEGAGQAGGRCRSYPDTRLQRTIDNGNHLVLSGNPAALSFLDLIGTRHELAGGSEAKFPFVDLASGERWAVHPNPGPVPWWILDSRRRIPGTGLSDYLGGVALALAGPGKSVGDVVPATGVIAERFWEPFTLAVMNAPPEESSARLLWSVVRETFVRGGAHCIPLFAARGLGAAFIDPALEFVRRSGSEITFNKRLTALEFDRESVSTLVFRDETVSIADEDQVVLAVSPAQLASFMPKLDIPEQSGVIVNAHFVVKDAAVLEYAPPFIGVLNGASQWIFVRDDVVSITISAAGALGLDSASEETMLPDLWNEVRNALNMDREAGYVAGRIVKEKRATFDQSPSAVLRRPKTATMYQNLMLAGDVIDTGLPATIEGAIRSGEMAAECVLQTGGKPGRSSDTGRSDAANGQD